MLELLNRRGMDWFRADSHVVHRLAGQTLKPMDAEPQGLLTNVNVHAYGKPGEGPAASCLTGGRYERGPACLDVRPRPRAAYVRRPECAYITRWPRKSVCWITT